MAMRQHAQYRDPETEAAKWNSAFISFIIYTCALPAVKMYACEKSVEISMNILILF